MPKQCDVLTIGNAVLDLLLSLPTSDSRCQFDTATGELRIKAGEKIAADKESVAAGGGAVRVAIALSRLGYATAIAADIGSDEFGKKILQALEAEHVDTERVVTASEHTSFSIGISYQQERTLFTYHETFPHEISLDAIEPSYIYLAALGEKWKGAYDAVAAFLTQHEGVKLAFNPGHTQLKAGSSQFQSVLAQTDILFINKEEALLLTGKTGEIPELLRESKALGPKAVVITDGKNGAYLIDQEGVLYHHAMVPAMVKEKTGAGDAFASGFLAGVMEGKVYTECMSWGACSSASVIGQLGGHAGLLTKGELRDMLERGDVPKIEKIEV